MVVQKDEKMVDAGDELEKKAAEIKAKKGGKPEVDKEAELSEEDLALKANLELMVERSGDPDAGVQVQLYACVYAF